MSTGEILPVAVEVIRERNAIKRSITGVRRLLKHGRQRVLIAGAAGTGKTTLGVLLGLRGAQRSVKTPGKYIISFGVETGKIDGLILSQTTVLPGQDHYRSTGVWEP